MRASYFPSISENLHYVQNRKWDEGHQDGLQINNRYSRIWDTFYGLTGNVTSWFVGYIMTVGRNRRTTERSLWLLTLVLDRPFSLTENSDKRIYWSGSLVELLMWTQITTRLLRMHSDLTVHWSKQMLPRWPIRSIQLMPKQSVKPSLHSLLRNLRFRIKLFLRSMLFIRNEPTNRETALKEKFHSQPDHVIFQPTMIDCQLGSEPRVRIVCLPD